MRKQIDEAAEQAADALSELERLVHDLEVAYERAVCEAQAASEQEWEDAQED